MNKQATLIISFALIIIIPWYVFWLAGENERNNPVYYAETHDQFAAIEIPENAIVEKIEEGGISIVQTNTIDSLERTYEIFPEGIHLTAPATVSIISPLSEDLVGIPIIMLTTATRTMPIANTHIDIDYKTNTIRATGEISELGTISVIDGGLIGFEFESYTNEYEIDTKFPIAWHIKTLNGSYESDTFSVHAIKKDGYRILATSSDFSVGYSKEVTPDLVPLDDSNNEWSQSYTLTEEYSCDVVGEFDWMFTPSITLLYAVDIIQGKNTTHSDIAHTITLRVTSKCTNGKKDESDTPV